MCSRGFHSLLAFLSFVATIGTACSALGASPTQPPPTAVPPTPIPVQPTPTSNSGGLVTFTDKNHLYQIDLPADWVHTSSSGQYYYIDTFTSPDKGAVIENIAYDYINGTTFQASQKGQLALQLLNQNYSKTGSEGDIKIIEEKQQPDGSDRLTWISKGGNYSGVSFFEIRQKTTFLMFTVDWGNDYESKYLDTLNKVIQSYRLP